MLDKFTIARALREISTLLALRGENPWKARAYEAGARALEEQGDELARLVEEKRLTAIRGIGEALASVIAELHQTGQSALLEELRRELPAGVVALSQLPNVGPKKAQALHRALGVSTLAELRAACEDGRVAGVRGFGDKTAQKILDGIRRFEARAPRTLLADALELGGRLVTHARACPAAGEVALAGSARRACETVSDLDLVAASDEPAQLMDWFVRFPLVADVEARGDTKCTVRLASGLQVDLRVVPPAAFPTALHHFTGSKAHHVKLRGRARARGLTISEWGLERLDGGARVPVASEAELYAALGLPYIPPELREDEGELEAADRGETFDDLVTTADVRGLVHCHTTFSDGKATVEEMARAADALGVEYLTITDHSPSAYYARGVELDRLKAQWDDIARVQELVKVRLLRGTESDILEDGALDYPDAILCQLDVVIASIHSRLKLDPEKMTARLCRAMRHPLFKIWGHPLGRLVEERDPIACDVEAVLDAAAASRAAIEVNGDPRRLDLPPRWIRAARARGLRFVVSVDAHSVGALESVRFGVAMARRGGVRRGELLNALPAEGFARAVRPA